MDIKDMTEEQLRGELEKIRAERSGKGRVKRAASRTKRIAGQQTERKRREDAEKVESAEWV